MCGRPQPSPRAKSGVHQYKIYSPTKCLRTRVEIIIAYQYSIFYSIRFYHTILYFHRHLFASNGSMLTESPFPRVSFGPQEKNRKLHIICKTARYLITVDPVLVQQQSCAGPRPPYLAVQSPVSSPTYGSRSWVGPGGGGHRELAGRCH